MSSVAELFPMAWWSAWTSAWMGILCGAGYLLAWLIGEAVHGTGPGWPLLLWGGIFWAMGSALALALRSRLSTARKVLRAAGALWLFHGALVAVIHSTALEGYVALLLCGYVAVHHLAAAQVLRRGD